MADGDVTHVKELGRYAIPGAGHNNIGQARNNKVLVWGEIKGTYVSTGMNLSPRGAVAANSPIFGLKTRDFLSLTVKLAGAAGTTVPAADTQFLATLKDDGKLFICDQVGTANPAVPTAGDIITLSYIAVGDDATVPDLV
jgi:hypothetical protein